MGKLNKKILSICFRQKNIKLEKRFHCIENDIKMEKQRKQNEITIVIKKLI